MSECIEFEFTDVQHKTLLDACKPTRVMLIGGHPMPSPQENANRAWDQMGDEMGFVGRTVVPVPGKSDRFFTAEKKEVTVSDKPRTHRPRKAVVLKRKGSDTGTVSDWWDVVERWDGGPAPETASKAQTWVNQGKYGEGHFWVLSTVEDPTKVEKVETPTYVYKASKAGGES